MRIITARKKSLWLTAVSTVPLGSFATPSSNMPATPDFTVFHNFVAGKPRGAKESYHGINPVTEEQLWDTPVAEEQDVEDAVAAATNAFPSWSRVPMSERRKKIGAWADRFSALRGLFKDLLKKECGKTVMSAEYEVELAMKNVVSYMRLSLPEETVELEDRTVYIRRVPLGVVAAICPWNGGHPYINRELQLLTLHDSSNNRRPEQDDTSFIDW